ncbi:MAG: hypothetical protein ACXW2Q_11540, partial [Thermoanaerobaculia bacterium]
NAVAEAWKPVMSISAWCLLAAQVPFIVHFLWNTIEAARGRMNVSGNHWQATTLEWAAASSPPLAHGNFVVMPIVYRGPYEYSSPECTDTDFMPQHEVGAELPPTGGGMQPAGAVAQRES